MMWTNISVLLMMFFVSSCRSVERALICNEVDNYQVDETEVCIVSIRLNSCLCTTNFDINSWTSTNDFTHNALDYCDGFMGVRRDFALREIQPKFKALQRLRESSCQKVKSPVSKNSNKNITIQHMSEEREYSSHSLD